MKYLDRGLILSHFYGLCQSERAFRNECKRLNVGDPPEFVSHGYGATTHLLGRGGKRISIVCIKADPKAKPEQILSLLVHEAVHVFQEVKHDMHEHEPSAEFEAYSIQKIVHELISAYRPKLIFK